MDRIYSLQALRAVAAIGVVIHHCVWTLAERHYGIAVGAAGVDVFFVISGIVMVVSTRPGTTAGQFLGRRIVRVVPLYWLATGAAVVYLYLRQGQAPSLKHLVASLLFLPLPDAVPYPLLYPGWSLNYEMFFYLLLAASLRLSQSGFGYIAVVTAALAAIGPRSGFFFLDYYLNPHMLEFSAGLMIGLGIIRGLTIRKAIGVALIAAGLVTFYINRGQPTGNVALWWGLPSMSVVTGLLAFENGRVVRWRAFQFLGAASYSIYLVHAFPLWVVDRIMGSERSALVAWLTVFGAIALGAAVYHYVEVPLFRWMTRRGAVVPSQRVGKGARG